jgi:hypothetical protein
MGNVLFHVEIKVLTRATMEIRMCRDKVRVHTMECASTSKATASTRLEAMEGDEDGNGMNESRSQGVKRR